MVSSDAGRQWPRVAIIGAGLSGMTMAIELKKRYDLGSVTIYERDQSIGGTWRDNVYPGCACDVPSHWYSLSTELNPDWTQAFSTQPEIRKYWEGIYRKYKLRNITQFDTSFVSGVWDASRNLWRLIFMKTSTKEPLPAIEAEVLISAVGGFSTPMGKDAVPIEGFNDFKGVTWHSARWNWGVDLKNKRVAAIGNGCSAYQFVPKLAEEPSTHVYNFSRTPAWTFKRPQYTFPAWARWTFRKVPGAQRVFRFYIFLRGDLRAVAFRDRGVGKYVRRIGEAISSNYIRKTAPKKYHEFLVPKYPLGCKRIIMDPGYLACLNQDNVDLVTGSIDRVTETGIATKDGQHYDVDVIILGTGFDVSAKGLGINLTGVDGARLGEDWKEAGGPQAMKGSAFPGYPNAFMLLGPNVATGHASAIFSIEAQIHYICKLIGPMITDDVKAWNVKPAAQRAEDAHTQGILKHSVWTSNNCTSYYKLPNGRVHVIWPASVTQFFWQTIVPDWSAYEQIGGTHQVNGGKAPGFWAKTAEVGRDMARTMLGLRI